MRARTIWFSHVTAAALLASACESAPPAKSPDATAQHNAAENAAPTQEKPEPPAGPAKREETAAPVMSAAPAAQPAADATAPADGIVFKKKAPAVGTKVSESKIKTMSLTVTVAGAKASDPGVKVKFNEREGVEKTVEVLAVSGISVTKVKVAYKESTKVESKDGAEKTIKSPVIGKTYIVEAKNGAVSVLTEQGAPVPAEEAKEVQDDFKNLGKQDDMQSVLPETPLRVGDQVDAIAEGLRTKLSSGDDGKTKTTVEKSSAKLIKINDKGGTKTGVFKIELDVVIDKSGMVIRMKMEGEVELRAEDGFPVAMMLTAPAAVASAPGAKGPKIGGHGLFTMSGTRQVL